LGIFSITIIKSKCHLLLALSLGVTIIISLVTVACNSVIAQTIETILEQRKAFENSPQIKVGSEPHGIAVNEITNKIYVTNLRSGTVSVIDSNSGSGAKEIRVGDAPISIMIDSLNNKIYVANRDSSTVSIIDSNNDTVIGQIPIGHFPLYNTILVLEVPGKIYVANSGSNTVSVINASNDKKESHDIAVGKLPVSIEDNNGKIYVVNDDHNGTVSVINASNDKKEPHDIAVGEFPHYIAADYDHDKIYVANSGSNTVSVINASNDKKESHDIAVGKGPSYIAADYGNDKIYVANTDDGTVSVINASNDKKEPHDIAVGKSPVSIAVNRVTNMIFVSNLDSNTVSVIDGFSNKVAAGVTLSIQPANSGKIICNSKEYPTNIYLYVDAGTNCIVKPNKDFKFIGWSQNLNRNSTIPLTSDSSGNLTINRYGTFTANFTPLPPAIPQEFLYLLVGIILSSLFGWSIPSIAGWYKARKQLEHLEECINQIGKLDKNAIETKIKGYYVHGKISEDHRQFLKDKISEYYENVKGS
jgi:YVTN family beta-propeller protein